MVSMGKAAISNFYIFKGEGQKFLLSLKLKLPSSQSGPRTTEAYLGVTLSGPPQIPPLKVPWKFGFPDFGLVDGFIDHYANLSLENCSVKRSCLISGDRDTSGLPQVKLMVPALRYLIEGFL